MNQKALKTLEYDKIISRLADKAGSDPGRAMCAALQPMTALPDIEQAQLETADALSRLFAKGSASFGSNRDFTSVCRHLEIGGSLQMKELLQIASFLENVLRIKSYGKLDKEQTDSLSAWFEQLEPYSQLAVRIRTCILSEEEIADDASPGLKSIRRSIAQTGDKIHSQLGSMVNGSLRTYLQDAVVTMRDNRYCLPVKAEHKGMVKGLVHDQSSTGSTVFIEPAAVVELNNKIKELSIKEQEEIERILAELSAECALYTEGIAEDSRIMTFLDFTFAKASLAMEQNATRPLFNTSRSIHIRKGRHPLLDQKKVVPIDIRLGEDFGQLIITGPNTGGKTVSLKTVGIFSLMGQAGLHIPALDRSELGIFTEVFADIGDEQSIEQSLSTFSSHMTNIVRILSEADDHSLCLFDELCAGTDPTEGAALAIAILAHLSGKNVRTMATTHYSEIKVYALSAKGVENACCEFDVETLSPTYRLLIGIPGKSNAFAISGKLGLPGEIIDAARAQLTSEEESFEDVLTDLENSRRTIEREREEIAAYKDEIQTLKRQLRDRQQKLDDSRDKILRQANEEARDILQEAKTVADETIRNFQKYGSGTSMKEMEAQRSKVRDHIRKKDDKLAQKAANSPKGSLKPSQLRIGDGVKVMSLNAKGTVSTRPDQKGYLFVQCGIIRSKVHISDLVLLQEEEIKTPGISPDRKGKVNLGKAASISSELNLLGKTVDEALSVLDKYLDDAYLAHLGTVRIVHGKGTGALRNAVHSHLKRQKYVDSFRLGEFGEGDAGVTIVSFR